LEEVDKHLSKQAEKFVKAMVRAGNRTIGKKSKGGGFGSQDGKPKPGVTPMLKAAWKEKSRLYKVFVGVSRSKRDERSSAWLEFKVHRNKTRALERKLARASDRKELEDISQYEASDSAKFYAKLNNRAGDKSKSGDRTIHGVKDDSGVVTRGEGVGGKFREMWSEISKDVCEETYDKAVRQEACQERTERRALPLPINPNARRVLFRLAESEGY